MTALWICCLPAHEGVVADGPEWAWRFTPRVTRIDEAWLLEVGGSLRLFGGWQGLWESLGKAAEPAGWLPKAAGGTALAALARARDPAACSDADRAAPPINPRQALDRLPLHCVTALRPHLDALQSLGCQCLGDLRQWPRAAVTRRWGSDVLRALDETYGERSTAHAWATAPERFDRRWAWNERIEHQAGLLFAGQRLLREMHDWLQQRNRGALELRWAWEYEPRHGQPREDSLDIRIAQPSRDVRHWGRLTAERLARAPWEGPVQALRLTVLESAVCGGEGDSLLHERPPQERLGWNELVERLQARLGDRHVQTAALIDPGHHRPGEQHGWHPAQTAPPPPTTPTAWDARWQPLAWLPEPWALPPSCTDVGGNKSPFGMTDWGASVRIETGWWDTERAPLRRVYRVASHPRWGWVWIYQDLTHAEGNWYLHGFYG